MPSFARIDRRHRQLRRRPEQSQQARAAQSVAFRHYMKVSIFSARSGTSFRWRIGDGGDGPFSWRTRVSAAHGIPGNRTSAGGLTPAAQDVVPTGLALVGLAYPGLTSGAIFCRPCGTGFSRAWLLVQVRLLSIKRDRALSDIVPPAGFARLGAGSFPDRSDTPIV